MISASISLIEISINLINERKRDFNSMTLSVIGWKPLYSTSRAARVIPSTWLIEFSHGIISKFQPVVRR